jgi:hypothetical protein
MWAVGHLTASLGVNYELSAQLIIKHLTVMCIVYCFTAFLIMLKDLSVQIGKSVNITLSAVDRDLNFLTPCFSIRYIDVCSEAHSDASTFYHQCQCK